MTPQVKCAPFPTFPLKGKELVYWLCGRLGKLEIEFLPLRVLPGRGEIKKGALSPCDFLRRRSLIPRLAKQSDDERRFWREGTK